MVGMAGLVTRPDLVTQADLVDPAQAHPVDPGADPAQAAAASAAGAAAAGAAAGNAAGLGVDGCGQRQQPRCGPQVLLAETTGQHLLAEDTVELLSGGQYRGAGVVEPVGQRHQS